MHSTTGSTVHSRPFNSLEHCICTSTTTNILPDRDSNLVPPGYKPQSIRMRNQGRPLIFKARKIKNGAIVFPSNKKSSLCLKYWGRYDNFCYDVMAAILIFYDTCSDVVRGIVCLPHPLVQKNMSFAEINSSLLNYWRVHANLSDFIAAISNFAW